MHDGIHRATVGSRLPGFDAFMRRKSTMEKSTKMEIPIRVPPFKNRIVILRILMH